ncbi:hypothetical protein GCM10027342_26940 [Photobacterium alginatilyticum]
MARTEDLPAAGSSSAPGSLLLSELDESQQLAATDELQQSCIAPLSTCTEPALTAVGFAVWICGFLLLH